MDQNSALILDIISTLEYCKRESKVLSIAVRDDVIDAIQQAPDYLQWSFNHGIRHAQMQLADVLIRTYTALIVDLDGIQDPSFDLIVEELILEKEHRSALLSVSGYQKLQFINALKYSMSLPLNTVHSIDELKETADALCLIVSKLTDELSNVLLMLKTLEIPDSV